MPRPIQDVVCPGMKYWAGRENARIYRFKHCSRLIHDVNECCACVRHKCEIAEIQITSLLNISDLFASNGSRIRINGHVCFLCRRVFGVDYVRRKFRNGPSSTQSELICVSPAPEMSETGPSLFFEPVSCKQEQGFVWGTISSRAGLTSYRSHVISPLLSSYW